MVAWRWTYAVSVKVEVGGDIVAELTGSESEAPSEKGSFSFIVGPGEKWKATVKGEAGGPPPPVVFRWATRTL